MYVGAYRELATETELAILRAWNRAMNKLETNLILIGPTYIPGRSVSE